MYSQCAAHAIVWHCGAGGAAVPSRCRRSGGVPVAVQHVQCDGREHQSASRFGVHAPTKVDMRRHGARPPCRQPGSTMAYRRSNGRSRPVQSDRFWSGVSSNPKKSLSTLNRSLPISMSQCYDVVSDCWLDSFSVHLDAKPHPKCPRLGFD